MSAPGPMSAGSRHSARKRWLSGGHPPVAIADQDAVGGGLQRRRQRRDRVLEPLRRLPAIGHVPAAADQAPRLAAAVRHDLAARVQHPHLAVGPDDAVIVDERRDVLDRLPDHRRGVLDVVRVHARQEPLVARDERGAFDAVDVEQLVGPG